jgi:hypothetical protein
VHFTREPIIESVITARDGYKLTVRSTKRGAEHEEYSVEAVEIVSFGKAQFFRSLEKPKPFLLPVSDFEVLETKETRVLLKGVSLEKSIKIGGGREAPMRAKEQQSEREIERPSGEEEVGVETSTTSETRRKDRKRHRRRRANEERSEMKEWSEKKRVEGPQPQLEEKLMTPGDLPPPATSPLLGTLIPPPTTLISESLARYKETLILEPPVQDEHVNEPPKEKGKDKIEEEAVAPQVYPMHSEEDETFLP